MTTPDLNQQHCSACRADSPLATAEEVERMLVQIPAWEIREEQGIRRLVRAFRFGNFRSALDFTNRVGELAEQEGHHPAITTEWGRVTVSWWTHKIGGLHVNDFIMAAHTDELA